MDHWERADFPFALARRLGELGLIGDGLEGEGIPAMSPLAAGLINMELNRGDGSLGTFLGVQAGLAMRSIAYLGSEEHRARWLPALARAEAFGAFALTEPEHGSDSVALETTARREGDEWVLDGAKRWIGNATIADVTVVWALDEADGEVKGLLVEGDPAGWEATRIEGKGSVRAVWQADITLAGDAEPAQRQPLRGGPPRLRPCPLRGRASLRAGQDRAATPLVLPLQEPPPAAVRDPDRTRAPDRRRGSRRSTRERTESPTTAESS